MIVVVGPEEAEYKVHRELLVEQPAFFRKPLAGNEDDDAHVKVPQASVWSFKVYWHWIYTGRVAHAARDNATSGIPDFVHEHRASETAYLCRTDRTAAMNKVPK